VPPDWGDCFRARCRVLRVACCALRVLYGDCNHVAVPLLIGVGRGRGQGNRHRKNAPDPVVVFVLLAQDPRSG
jgi:hypothetical protein